MANICLHCEKSAFAARLVEAAASSKVAAVIIFFNVVNLFYSSVYSLRVRNAAVAVIPFSMTGLMMQTVLAFLRCNSERRLHFT